MTEYSVDRYVMVVLRSAIKLYAKTGMKANRAYTPSGMKRTAERLTGETFRARDWDGMVAALSRKIEEVS